MVAVHCIHKFYSPLLPNDRNTMPTTCALSGELLSQDAVVTPSGHVCSKRLLLTKLSENGGRDPFDETRPLSEDALIELQQQPSTITAPPTSATSIPSLLKTLQSEYDALVLELWDTRQQLQTARQELAQALYQNDAALRVVARLVGEKDEARKSEVTTATTTTDGSSDEPPSKKAKVDETNSRLPSEDVQQLVAHWQEWHPKRKALVKETVAPTLEEFNEQYQSNKRSWHKTTCKGLVGAAVSSSNHILWTTSRDKQLIGYDTATQTKVQSVVLPAVATCLAVGDASVWTGHADGSLTHLAEHGPVTTTTLDSPIVSVAVHPGGAHVLAVGSDGTLHVLRQETVVAVFSDNHKAYTCGCLHPDGLIVLAGTSGGQVQVWDLKSQQLASALATDDETTAVRAVTVSNNGYHVAVVYESGAVKVWDLRKQTVLATLDGGDGTATVAFHPSGKYLAYGSDKMVQITTVKEWGETASFKANAAGALVWTNEHTLAACSGKNRDVVFWSKSE